MASEVSPNWPLALPRFITDEFERAMLDSQKLGLVPAPEFRRASGAAICPLCSMEFRAHPYHNPWYCLRILCNGEAVKL